MVLYAVLSYSYSKNLRPFFPGLIRTRELQQSRGVRPGFWLQLRRCGRKKLLLVFLELFFGTHCLALLLLLPSHASTSASRVVSRTLLEQLRRPRRGAIQTFPIGAGGSFGVYEILIVFAAGQCVLPALYLYFESHCDRFGCG